MPHSARHLGLTIALISAVSMFSVAMAQDETEHPRSYYPTLTRSDLESCQTEIGGLQKDVISHYRALAKSYGPGGENHYGPENDADNNRYTEWANAAAAKNPVTWYEQGVDDGDATIGGLNGMNGNAENVHSWYSNLAKGLDQYGGPRRPDDSYDVVFNEYHQPVYEAAETCIAKNWMAKFNAMHPDETPVVSAPSGDICTRTPEEERDAFNADILGIRADHPKPDEDAGSRATYRWTYAFALVGLDKIELRRQCLGQYYAPNLAALEKARNDAKKGCEDLSSVGGPCPKEFP